MTKHEMKLVAKAAAGWQEPTEGPWTIRRTQDPTYPDLATYDVLAPNPDAGKSGVSYSGEHLMVAAGLDSEGDARLIAAAPEMWKLIKEELNGMSSVKNMKKVGALLTKIEGK